MKVLRKIIEINEDKCDGCGNCVVSCAEGAIQIIDGKAKVIKDMFCDGLGACMGSCPQDALKIIEREADPFDEEAVHKHLEDMKKKTTPSGCGCQSSAIMTLKPMAKEVSTNNQVTAISESQLANWPLKIRLIPPNAPYLKNADILILADCSAAAYANLHGDFLKGKVVMMGCPKFDDSKMHIEKLAQVFAGNAIKSITIARMEVPCCAGMAVLVREAQKMANTSIPVSEEIITRSGERTKPETLKPLMSPGCGCGG